MRVLATATSGAGHLNPVLILADTLADRGDDVLLMVPPSLEAPAAASGHPYRLGADPPAHEVAAIRRRLATAPPAEAAVLGNRHLFGRLSTRAMLEPVADACRDVEPDLVLHDAAEYAGAIVAQRRGVPHAQVAISPAAVEWSSLDLAAVELESLHHGIVDRIRATPYLTRFPSELDPSPYPDTRRFHRASTLLDRPEAASPLPDWWGGDSASKPLVYLTFGSVTADLPIGHAVFETALAAMTDLPVRVLMTLGRRGVDGLGPIPDHVHVEGRVPHAPVMAVCDLVVCHGGSGTVLDALEAGLPLIVVPLFADQPVNARLVSGAGAGLVVAPAADADGTRRGLAPGDAPRLEAATTEGLGTAAYRQAAQRLRRRMRASPSAEEIVSGLFPGGDGARE